MKGWVVIIFPLILLLSCGNKAYIEGGHRAEEGLLDLSGESFEKNISLEGQWLFTSGHFSDADPQNWSTLKVPARWNGRYRDGTYSLTVKLPPSKDYYGIYIPDCYTSYRIRLNEDSYRNGDIGENYAPTLKPRIFPVHAGGELDIRIMVSDYDTTFGGITSPPYLGKLENIQSHYTRKNVVDAVSIGVLLFSGFFSLVIWFVSRDSGGRRQLILALLSFWMIVRFASDYNSIILHYYDFYLLHEKLTWLNIPVIVFLFGVYFHQLYDIKFYKILLKISLGLSVVYGLIVLFGSVKVAYRADIPYELIMIVPMTATLFVTAHDVFVRRRSVESLYWFIVMVIGILLFGGNSLKSFNNNNFNTESLTAFIIPVQILLSYFPYRRIYDQNTKLYKHKNDIFMRISDSLKTPLYGITGLLDIMSRETESPQKLEKEVKAAQVETEKLSRQIDYLLSVSRADVVESRNILKPKLVNAGYEIVIIDDVEINRSIVKEQLKQVFRNGQFHLFESGEAALAFDELHFADMIFCDLMMPGMDGFEFTRACRKQGLLMPLFIFSASLNRENRQKALAFGADGYLTKPLKIDEIHDLFQLYL
ncbi:response regulator [Spirochaeta isovalerica]|uniref:histidine kinase n=1 Tax=Spirochaeta isovalerica TaxID=150 RepID=A0A841R6Y4_9SPIO|nr:response regulator [Spirochaeta isovalerica]MBB6479605.1 CheY-like chemotaxis protein [Spirochaeta isovalerica]